MQATVTVSPESATVLGGRCQVGDQPIGVIGAAGLALEQHGVFGAFHVAVSDDACALLTV